MELEQLLGAVAACSEAERKAQEALRDAVQAARNESASWTAIGESMGVTRQAATQRFGPKGRTPIDENQLDLFE